MKIAHGTLIMALDGGKMLLMRNEGDVPRPALEMIEERVAENPRTSLQGTDRPGRSISSSGPRRSAVDNTDWHEEGEQRFAIEAVETLSQVQSREQAPVIVLAARPVLGTVRKHCPQALGKRIVAEIDKDVVNLTTEDIIEIVASYEPSTRE